MRCVSCVWKIINKNIKEAKKEKIQLGYYKYLNLQEASTKLMFPSALNL